MGEMWEEALDLTYSITQDTQDTHRRHRAIKLSYPHLNMSGTYRYSTMCSAVSPLSLKVQSVLPQLRGRG